MNNKIKDMFFENKEEIIKLYQEGKSIREIAGIYGVAKSTIYIKLRLWNVRLKDNRYTHNGSHRKKKEKRKYKREFSKELLEKMKRNSEINNQHIKHFKIEDSKENKELIKRVLC